MTEEEHKIPKRRRTKKRKKHWVRRILALLALIAIGIICYYGISIYKFAHDIQADPNKSPFSHINQSNKDKGKSNEPPKWEGTERVNILLMGGDSRGLSKNEVPRSDSMLIASLDPQTKKAYLFSILRDTYVDIPDHGQERINAAITLGGPELAMKTVSDLTGLQIQYYVYTDFQGFIKLIDALGGIDFTVEKDMYYTSAADKHQYDINLKAGEQHLDGTTALEYVRFRHDARSDYARTERQRNFLTAVAQKLKTGTSLIKLPQILKSVAPYIETNLSINDMWRLGSLGYECDANAVTGQQLPPDNLLKEETIGGASVLGTDPRAIQQFVQNLFDKDAAATANEPGAEPAEDGEAAS